MQRKVNLRKHGFDFLDAPRVFRGATLTVADNRQHHGEERFIPFGLLRDTVVAIAHTEQPDSIRTISMPKGYGVEADSEDEE